MRLLQKESKILALHESELPLLISSSRYIILVLSAPNEQVNHFLQAVDARTVHTELHSS